MTQELAMYLTEHALMTAMIISAPMLLAGLIVGVLVSMFQAVTQINEMTLTFIPKLIATALVLLLFIQWMSVKLMDFVRYIFEIIPLVAK